MSINILSRGFSSLVSTPGYRIVFHHGLLGRGKNWQSIAKSTQQQMAIKDRPVDVVSLDARNHGDSFRSDKQTYSDMSSDLFHSIKLLDKEAGRNVPTILVGHSMGGKVVGQFLADVNSNKYPAIQRPRVIGAVIVDIALRPYSETHRDIFNAIGSVPVETLSVVSDADKFLSTYNLDLPMMQFLKSNLTRDEAGGYRWFFNPEGLVSNYTEILDAPTLPCAPIPTPLSLIYGGNSPYVNDNDLNAYQQLFRVFSSHCIPEAGHWVHAEKPRDFRRSLLAAIESFI